LRKAYFLVAVICLSFIGQLCQAQTPIQVSDPKLELRDHVVHISYEILNSKITDRYDVSLEVLDANNGTIVAKTVSGDIGESVSGGDEKLIKWDLKADSIFMEADIYIKVRARLIPAPVAVSKAEYGRSGLIIQSLALPGLGLSRMTGKPHWIRGVAGYGCVAGSIVLNRKAISSYDDYLNQRTSENAQELFQASTQYDGVSEVLGYAAIGIWVTDIIWTIMGTSGLHTEKLTSNDAGLSLATGFDPEIRAPLLGFRITF
jgi:hypothetical protein